MPEYTYSKEELDQKFKTQQESNDAWSADILRAIQEVKDLQAENHAAQIKRADDLEEKMQPIIEIYDGSGILSKFVVSTSKLLLAIGIIGASFLYIVNWIRHG